ncbi:hypothetical protein TNCV_3243451 [Trichonephila clavipes]|nr:hypothetical protein TNCV_3243451 [Trichonephila clavipes]
MKCIQLVHELPPASCTTDTKQLTEGFFNEARLDAKRSKVCILLTPIRWESCFLTEEGIFSDESQMILYKCIHGDKQRSVISLQYHGNRPQRR